MKSFAIIVAVDEKNGIGYEGKLPWPRLPQDMKHFKQITTAGGFNAVIMGRKTFESLSSPLPNRLNIVITRNRTTDNGFICTSSLVKALSIASAHPRVHNVFVIGGAQVYQEALLHPKCATLHLTRIHKEFKCDTYFPLIPKGTFNFIHEQPPIREQDVSFTFETHDKFKYSGVFCVALIGICCIIIMLTVQLI